MTNVELVTIVKTAAVIESELFGAMVRVSSYKLQKNIFSLLCLFYYADFVLNKAGF